MNSKQLCLISFSVALLLCGCGFAPDECDTFPTEYGRLRGNINLLKQSRLDDGNKAMVSKISRCYKNHPYRSGTNIKFAAKIKGKQFTYLIFDVEYLTDIELVYEVGENNRVVRAFAYSDL